ncbi:hypothetical protein BFJ71_g17029 [Fusarium oxysporum]|nr:hypothetical protein BFJ71_g17029 [Fusarium oxysporum]
MAGLLPLLCIGLLMPGLATAGLDGHPLQGREIPECDSNCGQSNTSPTTSNTYLTRYCLLGTWCCPPALRCAYVEMAGGWSCFENKSYTQSAFTELPTTASTLLDLSDASVITDTSLATLSTTASSKATSNTNKSPRYNIFLWWKYYYIAIIIFISFF